ncbi:sentrin-specific protease 1 isoform X2 [Melanotaenia boesemani]|uniref:sentrin-specific protease 1 isoform X2 n=1 Tax=Melanotaenia boesemani TaxID=1250792 RepID=UPI001C03EE88|nr:sentrin-specific protease 1 isoform X2 [Melanotaenia boesemani]
MRSLGMQSTNPYRPHLTLRHPIIQSEAMLNKIYEWVETSFANLRNGEPAAEHSHGQRATRDGQMRRKRSSECLEEVHNIDKDGLVIKRSRIGDLMDTVKSAAEGVKSHSTSVATWMKNSVSPTLRNFLPTSPDAPFLEPQPSTSAAVWTGRPIMDRNSLDGTFAAPSATLEWKTSKSEWSRNEKSIMGSKVCRRKVCMSPTHREVPKTNGHSVNMSPSIAPKFQPIPRLGRPLNLRPHGISSFIGGVGTPSSSCTSMYEKTFPIKVVQSPTHSTSSSHAHRSRPRCTAQESVREEEKEIYRQLLTMVSGGQSSFLHNGSSHTILRSHRDFTSFLTSRRILQISSPAGSAADVTSEGPSSPLSPRGISSQCSSNLPSPVGASSKSGTGSQDTDLNSNSAAALASLPSPSALQDNTSQDTQSSAPDGNSVIIVNEQKGKKQDGSSVRCFQAELWIKELTSMYDSRARERRRQIEEQEALATQLLRQRLSEEGQHSSDVEVRVRVPLEKEVPLTLVIEEPKGLEEKPEFPELTEEMEAEVNRALMKGGNPHEVLSEGFGLSLTRKDLQTLSSLNWLNDEVINFYMNLLVERSKKSNLPSVNTFNTFFYPKLCSSGYSAVRRWTKKMDIFAKDILLVPVHLGVHWCLSVVDFRKKSIMYFDSMGGNNDQACQILFNYLQQESKDKKAKELDTSGWTLHSKKPSEIPQQMNGSDCGMFTCKYADYITKDKPITFTQKHMPYFRRRMVWEIVNHKLL